MTFLSFIFGHLEGLCFYNFLFRDAIVTWVKKKTGPNLHNLTTIEDAERILTAESKIVLGFLDTLVVYPLSELNLGIILGSIYFLAVTNLMKIYTN